MRRRLSVIHHLRLHALRARRQAIDARALGRVALSLAGANDVDDHARSLAGVPVEVTGTQADGTPSHITIGLATGRPLLQMLLEAAYPGLTEKGWRQLTINWTIFFIFMAVLNEIVRHRFSYDFWLSFKLWGAIPLTLLFTFANIPMLLKNGLNAESAAPIPPEG